MAEDEPKRAARPVDFNHEALDFLEGFAMRHNVEVATAANYLLGLAKTIVEASEGGEEILLRNPRGKRGERFSEVDVKTHLNDMKNNSPGPFDPLKRL